MVGSRGYPGGSGDLLDHIFGILSLGILSILLSIERVLLRLCIRVLERERERDSPGVPQGVSLGVNGLLCGEFHSDLVHARDGDTEPFGDGGLSEGPILAGGQHVVSCGAGATKLFAFDDTSVHLRHLLRIHDTWILDNLLILLILSFFTAPA